MEKRRGNIKRRRKSIRFEYGMMIPAKEKAYDLSDCTPW